MSTENELNFTMSIKRTHDEDLEGTSLKKKKLTYKDDFCIFKKCFNGVETGHHLFKFPQRDPRRSLWIELSGIFSLL